MAAAEEIDLGVVAVVTAEARHPRFICINQGQPFNGSNEVFFPQSRPQMKCYRCNQPGHRHNECTATITLNPNPNINTLGQGNTAMVAPPPPPPSSAGPSASTSTMAPTYSSSSGGQQHPRQFMTCLVRSGKYRLTGQTHFSRTDDGRELWAVEVQCI